MQIKPPRETDSPEEMLDLVDEQDNVIGSKSRKEVYAEGLRNYRVVHAFIVNSEGKLWIPRRVSTKNYIQMDWTIVLPVMLSLEKLMKKE